MPLNSEQDYERLGEHLAEIDAPLAAFATAHRYVISRRGRYPNRRITQDGRVTRSIEIGMDMDEHGQRFDDFFPEIPYVVWGGAWVDDSSTHTRFSGPHIRTWALPFSVLVSHLAVYLHHFHSYL